VADMRIPSSGIPPQAVRAPQRSEAARAAQKAFFDAARTGTATSATSPQATASVQRTVVTKPVTEVRATAPIASPRAQAVVDSATGVSAGNASAPQRLARPGSILNILV